MTHTSEQLMMPINWKNIVAMYANGDFQLKGILRKKKLKNIQNIKRLRLLFFFLFKKQINFRSPPRIDQFK